MYCVNCGSKVSRDARFCQGCGAAVQVSAATQQAPSAQQNEPPLKVIKPVFLTWVVLFAHLPLQINLTFIGGAVFGGIGFLALLYTASSLPYWLPFACSLSVFFFGTPLLVYIIGQRTYAKTDYKFYRQHLEYVEGFWNIEHQVIQYRHITQVTLQKSVVQRLFGLGTIYLSVPSLPPSQGFSGVRIADIRQPEQLAQQIQTILKER